jgi:hypothetical protein
MSQADDNKRSEKIIRTIFIIAIVVTFLFLGTIIYFWVRIENGDGCGYTTYTQYRGLQLTDKDFTMTSDGDYILQEITLDTVSGIGYEFCFDATVNGTEGVQVSIIDKFLNRLGIDYLDNSSTNYCTELDEELVTKQNFIGVRCEDCSSVNNVTLRKEITGTTVKQMINESASLRIEEDNTLSYRIIGNNNCKELIKTLLNLYFTIIILFGLIILILIGFGKFRDLLFKDI